MVEGRPFLPSDVTLRNIASAQTGDILGRRLVTAREDRQSTRLTQMEVQLYQIENSDK